MQRTLHESIADVVSLATEYKSKQHEKNKLLETKGKVETVIYNSTEPAIYLTLEDDSHAFKLQGRADAIVKKGDAVSLFFSVHKDAKLESLPETHLYLVDILKVVEGEKPSTYLGKDFGDDFSKIMQRYG